MPDIKRGEQFMKAVVKASLYALFSIGIRSSEMIDRFVISFTENFEKQMELIRSEPVGTPPVENKKEEKVEKKKGKKTKK